MSRSVEQLGLGQKRNGLTTGIPVNPINHSYDMNYNGEQFRAREGEKKLNHMLRMHHIQKHNGCGYNLLNGKENTPVGRTL